MRYLILVLLTSLVITLQGQNLQGTKVTSSIVPNDIRDDYPTHADTLGFGGYRVVTTLTERDAIKVSRRKIGMLVLVIETGTIYTLNEGITNINWTPVYFTKANQLDVTNYLHVYERSGAAQTSLFQVFDSALYNRFLITNKGLLVSGKQHNPVVNVDGLALIGSRCSLGGINSATIGYNAFNKGDTSIVIGAFIDSSSVSNQITIGSGISATQRLLNNTAKSVAIGANATTPQLLITNAAVTITTPILNTTGQLQTNGNQVNYPLSVYAAGTAYTLTATSAYTAFGTTSPQLTINKAGTYRISARVQLKYNAATFAANQTVTLKLRRSNNTAADLTNATSTITADIVTTKTGTLCIVMLPEVIYTTSLATDIIQLWGNVSVLPSAGTVTVTEASIIATRLY